ncbi:hypothetical protein PV08_09298 [Exophiala spinifera]|uniref:ABC transporter domain-containing protein n=1 Tax=Exophiala spinifera TaxID=91928 RepID=A0A0D2BLI4_9EURO|nr:uncharacterized protein PV08_09298 [Exophiala spinifera]KIW12024.1 hypothetical protein PV08_09298 [Exophiala spinifera]
MGKQSISHERDLRNQCLGASSRSPSTSVELLANFQNELSGYQTVDVRVRHLSVTVEAVAPSPLSSLDALRARINGSKKTPTSIKKILDDVSADFPSRSLTAIVGASGSGKTMLLNVISGRMKAHKFRQSGTVTYKSSTNNCCGKVDAAYVLQQDVLLPTLTVRETLQLAADLRLSTTKTKAERCTMVETVIAELGLQTCANTKIGDPAHNKGCSGGERRRTSIGIQLLADQPILILDEPTTGLDAASAIQVVQTLSRLARKGKTIIMTIHQPRSEIWRLVDNIVLLSRGSPVYSGSVKQCLPHFERMGYKLPSFFNPFDFIVDLAAIDIQSVELEKNSSIRVDQLLKAWASESASYHEKISQSFTNKSLHSNRATSYRDLFDELAHETMVLTRRTFIVTYRDRLGLFASIIEATSMGMISGWVFYHLGGDLSGIKSRQGALYTASAVQSYLVLVFETYRLSVDIEIYDRERIEGTSRPVTFVLSRRLSRILVEDIPVPILFSLIFYFMAGFRPQARQFFTFLVIQTITHLASINLASICVAINRQFMVASLLANLSFTLQTFACGYFINTHSLAVWLRWTKWISYIFYAFSALCTNEFRGHMYDCPYSGEASNQACKEYWGEYILEALNVPSDWLWRPIVVLVGFTALFFGLSILLLQLITIEVKLARSRQSEVSCGEDHERSTRTTDAPTSINITLDGFGIDLETRRLFKAMSRKQICAPITTNFESGSLNVIMGPSGSGKSTCLNTIAQRPQSSPVSRYLSCGTIRLNGAIATDSVLRSICSYVPQDDTGLLPSLTVRETLYFAAQLRLPHFVSHEQKLQRAESILLRLGLKECADTLVGNEFMKGVSGGEKRRVSIGIQILTDPKVLLLDEPTSGLDAFTADSIIKVLQSLADEGRTVILSIHQPRSDTFRQFGKLLLLTHSGDVAYAGGVPNILPHFSEIGYTCPDATNPADFIMDLVSDESFCCHQQQEGILLSSIKADERPLATSRVTESPSGPTTFSREGRLSLPAEIGAYKRSQLPFSRAFPILLRRGMINLKRQPELLIGRVTQIMGLGIVLAAFVAPLQNDYYAVQSRVGYILTMSSMMFVGMLNSIAMYPTERDIYYHEDRDNTYTVEAFFCYYSFVEFLFELLGSLLYAVLTVFAVGLPRTASQFFLMTYSALCVVSCGESFGILFLTMFSHTGLAVSVMTVMMAISVSLAGVLSISLDRFLTVVSYVSPVKWQVGALLSYTLRGTTFTCSDQQRLGNGTCPIQTGDQVLQLYKLDVSTLQYALILGAIAIGYRLLAYLGLKTRRVDWTRCMRMELPGRKNVK